MTYFNSICRVISIKSIASLEQVHVRMANRRVFREGNFFVIENNPSAILFQVRNIVPRASIFSNVTYETNEVIFAITIFERCSSSP